MCQIRELSVDEQGPGLRLALRELDDAQFRVQAEAFCEAATAPLPAPVRVWGAFRKGVLAGSVLAQVQPGRSAMLWPPRVVDGDSPQTATLLLQTALAELADNDLLMTQALLPTDAGEDADILRAAGFRHFSDLLYLVCPSSEFPAVRPTSSLDFQAIEAKTERRFANVVEATYEGTLDCPAVNGVRNMEDVLLGYRATGRYDPKEWLFVRHGNDDVGCLIVCDHPAHETCELIYMGLMPAARRRGFGAAVLRHALWLAAAARQQRLVLAVDAANEPALRTYAAAGFQAWDRKSVFIRVMRASAAPHYSTETRKTK